MLIFMFSMLLITGTLFFRKLLLRSGEVDGCGRE